MTYWKRTGSILVAVIALTPGILLTQARAAEAHGRGLGRRPALAGGLYGAYFGPGFGFSFGPYGGLGPWGGAWGGPWTGYYSSGGVDMMTVAKMVGWGALELDVKPNRADVWVDGKYVGEARDLDGYPSSLWLEKGPHKLAIYKGGHRTFEEEVAVERGASRRLRVRLEPGASSPPGEKPAAEK